MKKEIRVYAVNYVYIDGDANLCSDEDFMMLAEQTGNIYTLKKFQDIVNDYFPFCNYLIRFIEVETFE